MEILNFTYTIPLFDNLHIAPYGKIIFKNKEGKVISKNYEIDKKIGKYLVQNCGTLYAPNLKIIEAK